MDSNEKKQQYLKSQFNNAVVVASEMYGEVYKTY